MFNAFKRIDERCSDLEFEDKHSKEIWQSTRKKRRRRSKASNLSTEVQYSKYISQLRREK